MNDEPPTRLTRALGTPDAVVVGLGAMLGAGIFAGVGPAAQRTGESLFLPALAIAAGIAFLNATSAAQLAAIHPASGGTYVYGCIRLGPSWGFLAGWTFVAAKIASCAALARAFAAHAVPDGTGAPWPQLAAVGLTLALTLVNATGIRKTARATWVLVGFVIASLIAFVASGPRADVVEDIPCIGCPVPTRWDSTGDLLAGAALLFFAFAGYARIATLGEEVRDPARTIPQAIPLALAIATATYAVVGRLLVRAPSVLSESAPLAAAVQRSRVPDLETIVRAGAIVATASVLLSLLAGVSRTLFAMGAEGDAPRVLAAVGRRTRVPHAALFVCAAAVAGLAAAVDLRQSIGFSAFTVLVYYALTNAAALRLRDEERQWPQEAAWGGLIGCVVLAVMLPIASVIAGAVVTAAGGLAYAARRRFSRG